MTVIADHTYSPSPRSFAAIAAAAAVALVLSIVLPFALHSTTTTVLERSVATAGPTTPTSYSPALLREAHGG